MYKIEKDIKDVPTYEETTDEKDAKNELAKNFVIARNIINKGYNQFNGRTLYDTIDDWTLRWNGYIFAPEEPGKDGPTSNIFLNFTRNIILTYVAKVGMQAPEQHITAVNKKTGTANKRIAEIYKNLLRYSFNAENGDARFLEATIECATKGTVIVYEGYAKNVHEINIPQKFDATTGKIVYKKEKKVIFDNCFQRIVPVEDLYISNPYQPDIQKQPFIIWREITSYDEAQDEYGGYKNWEYVNPGKYQVFNEPTTFYKNRLLVELEKNQVEIFRYYNRRKNLHIVQINGVIMYAGPIPFKDGKYPFAKTIFEPFGNDFFWGMAYPQKIMGEQDTQNTVINMLLDKLYGSLSPYGLSSDLDDLIEDDMLTPNKIRKVGDINKWKFDTLPGPTAGEMNMFQLMLNLGKENAGNPAGGGQAYSPKGGKLNVRQVLLQQQESQSKLGFSAGFMEDFERDRTELRLSHILQFYSIPKIEKITGRGGKEIEKLIYRDITVDDTTLESGEKGQRVIKLIGDEYKNPDKRQKLADEMSVQEAMGEINGTPTEVLAVSVDTFTDYNYSIQIVKNSTFEKNSVLDQAARMEYANWRIQMMQLGVPTDLNAIVQYVDEGYDIDTDRFTPAQQPGQQPGQPAPAPQMPGTPGQSAPKPMNSQKAQPASQMAPSQMGSLSNIM